jgi:cytochrome oxidase Cu insertion factor (SCO1/SenC/PrrC family)
MASSRAAAMAAGSPYDDVVPLAKVGDALPQASFVDQTGRRVTAAGLRGDVIAIAFIYLRCKDACPLTTRKLDDVRTALGSGPYKILEVTIDPQHDDLTAARAFAAEYRMDAPTWSVLTGAAGSIVDFDKRMGVEAVASGPAEIIHNDRLALVGPDGRIADFIDGASWTPADVAARMRNLSGRSSSPLARLDLALGSAAAYCGGLVAGRTGVGDVIASGMVLGIGVWLFVWLYRKMAAARG